MRKEIKEKIKMLQSQSSAFASLAKVWENRIPEIAKKLLTVKDPQELEDRLQELRFAVLQYQICRGLSSFALALSESKAEERED